MKDASYFFFTGIIRTVYWKQAPLVSEDLAHISPSVLVSNHLSAKGPVSVVCALRLRLYPWVIADMVSKQLAPEYLRLDFVEPSLGLRMPFSQMVARLISLFSVPLLNAMECIPVNRSNHHALRQALLETVEALKKDRIIVIFPEEPSMDPNPMTKMRPFLKGFTRLGELYFHDTGQRLRFYPIAIHESRKIMVGQAMEFNPQNRLPLERRRLKNGLETSIQSMYLEMERKCSLE